MILLSILKIFVKTFYEFSSFQIKSLIAVYRWAGPWLSNISNCISFLNSSTKPIKVLFQSILRACYIPRECLSPNICMVSSLYFSLCSTPNQTKRPSLTTIALPSSVYPLTFIFFTICIFFTIHINASLSYTFALVNVINIIASVTNNQQKYISLMQ